ITNSQNNDTNYLFISSESSSVLNIFVDSDISKDQNNMLEEQSQHLFDSDSSDQKSDDTCLQIMK
ncbi:14828_t:CDS:1, partial [Racocetra fulgida]